MKYLEIASYITFTLLAIFVALILSARLAGPRAVFPARPEDPPRKTSLAAFSFVAGGIVMVVQTRALITILEYKIPTLPNYLVDSNRLFFVLFSLVASGFLMLDMFLAPSRWQLALIGISSGSVIGLLAIAFELADLEDLEFVLVVAGIIFVTGIVTGLIHWIGVKRFRNSRSKWIQPAYIAPGWCARGLTSRLSCFVLFAIVGVITYLAWADLPLL